MVILTLALIGVSVAPPCGTTGAVRTHAPANFVFFGRDRGRIADTAFLRHPNIEGAQLTYSWRELEPERDRYHLDELRADLAHLQRHGKRLFLQLQDVSFSERANVPEYLLTDSSFHGGAARKHERDARGVARFDGWIARRWDAAVRRRHALLLQALAREFDGAVEGIVLPETAVSFDDPAHRPADFTVAGYADGIMAMLSAARGAFSRSCVIVYANFMPGDSPPLPERAYLRQVFEHAARIGAGVGGPDILPFRPFQRANGLGLVAARPVGMLAGMAVQDGNLADRDRTTGERITVAALHAFARDTLRLDYVFWGAEEPYYSGDVLPFLRDLPRGVRRR